MRTVLLIIVVTFSFSLQAESKRVIVYENTQQSWQVRSGQSLSLICQQLRPGNTHSQHTCQQQILKKNPAAFVNKNPNRLLAGKRLWLPGSYQSGSQRESTQFQVQHFSWGSIKTAR
ncbi:MAG: hypothetical protein OEY11_01970 [Gammaproteobacteria bacterium]|nr:hypothetical protein [Gammaproteobacteria bacterium]